MSDHPLDRLQITQSLFFPRRAVPQDSPAGEWIDGTVDVADDAKLGYRFFVHQPDSPVIMFFHGNGEVASDYVGLHTEYWTRVGASLLVVDYRGYGWSTGRPLTSKMLPDAKVVTEKLPEILKKANVNVDVPLFIKGRSLGSAPAIYLGLVAGDQFKGLIIESGYADAPSLFRRLGIAIPQETLNDDTLPIGNGEKIKRVDLPLLVIHGSEDNLIPVEHGETLHTNSPVEDKKLVVITGAGHNNLLISLQPYFSAINEFVNNHLD